MANTGLAHGFLVASSLIIKQLFSFDLTESCIKFSGVKAERLGKNNNLGEVENPTMVVFVA